MKVNGELRELLYCVNLDLEQIKTLIDVHKYEELLLKSGYPEADRRFLVNGFSQGFDTGYE